MEILIRPSAGHAAQLAAGLIADRLRIKPDLVFFIKAGQRKCQKLFSLARKEGSSRLKVAVPQAHLRRLELKKRL